MDSQEFIKNDCPLCGGSTEFQVDGAGQWVECPHCNQKIQLHRPAPESIKRLSDFVNSMIAGKNWLLTTGYLFAVIWPIGGVLFGACFLLATKKRAHGAAMIVLSLLVMAVMFLG